MCYGGRGGLHTARDTLRRIRDAGVRVGLSTHNPAVVEYVEEKGWGELISI